MQYSAEQNLMLFGGFSALIKNKTIAFDAQLFCLILQIHMVLWMICINSLAISHKLSKVLLCTEVILKCTK